jgi:hypothetical protein
VEGRLPTDIASVLMPLLAASDGRRANTPAPLPSQYAVLLKASVSHLIEEKDGDVQQWLRGCYITLEAQAVMPIYRTQLFTKVCKCVHSMERIDHAYGTFSSSFDSTHPHNPL